MFFVLAFREADDGVDRRTMDDPEAVVAQTAGATGWAWTAVAEPAVGKVLA